MNKCGRTIYLDYKATTPLDSEVRAAMLPLLDKLWGNPSSVHHVGREARAALDDARENAARVLKAKPSEIVFTSGGTESNNLAILGTARKFSNKGRHLITSTIEHHAVLQCFDYLERHEGFAVTRVPVTDVGLVDLTRFEAALRPDTILVSVMAANNEIGTIQPVAQIGAICQNRGILFHTDAVQWFGKQPFDCIGQFNADLVSICAHKFHGPKGAGMLFIRSPLHPHSILLGGAHENERRAGTENLAGIIGLVEAMNRFIKPPVFNCQHLRPLSSHLEECLKQLPGVHIVAASNQRLPNTVAFVTESADNIALLAGLDLEGICASSGSACSAGSLEPSHVVLALGLEKKLANSLVRFSSGRETSMLDILQVEAVLPKIMARVKASQQKSKRM